MIGTRLQCIKYLADIKDEKKQYEVKEHREKRSLTANAYYWTLLGQMAEMLRTSTARIHNGNLRSLWFVERVEDRLVTVTLPDTDDAENQVLESTTYHLGATSQTREGRDGVKYRTYVMLRGSHTFDQSEFSALLDLAVQDAESMGIDTVTPTERQKMLERYGKEYAKKHNTAG